MYFGVTPFCLQLLEDLASASIRMPSSSSGAPTMLTPSRLKLGQRSRHR